MQAAGQQTTQSAVTLSVHYVYRHEYSWQHMHITVSWMPVQMCGKPVITNQGKCLRPDTGRVILYLDGINLPK